MSGRHDSFPAGRARWAPIAAQAAVAAAPVGALAAALGLAGSGYLLGRADVASAGAVVGAAGLVAERYAARGVRRRLRRERARSRDALRQVGRDVQDLRRELTGLRSDLDGVRAERDSIGARLDATLARWSTTSTGAAHPASAGAAHPASAGGDHPVSDEAGTAAVEVRANTDEPTTAPILIASMTIPGQVRSPIATGGIPVLPPGPSEPVRVIDLRTAPDTRPVQAPARLLRGAARAGSDDLTRTVHQDLPRDTVDGLVWTAMDEARSDELTRILEVPERGSGRHSGALHHGDAHHAGDYAREDVVAEGGVLFVVNRGRHVA